MQQPSEYKLFERCSPALIQIFIYLSMVKQVKPKMQVSLKYAWQYHFYVTSSLFLK